GTKSLYIASFYPGYIDAGLVGVSSAILDQIYSIGTDNKVEMMYLSPFDEFSAQFWEKQGFALDLKVSCFSRRL
ncbi:MAG: hypothetical protein ACRCXZ_09150, partial [Patescibacteria group bacterium]